jgi:hypothetical protein
MRTGIQERDPGHVPEKRAKDGMEGVTRCVTFGRVSFGRAYRSGRR